MSLNFFNTITFVNAFGSIILALFFLINKHGNILTNRLLAIVLFIFTLLIFYAFSVSNWAYQIFMPYHKLLFLIYQTVFLIGPLIYLYFRKKLSNSNQITSKDLLHVVPFITIITFLTIYYNIADSFVIWINEPHYYIVTAIYIHLFIYLLLSINCFYKSGGKVSTFFKELLNETPFAATQLVLLSYIFLWIVCLHSLAVYMLNFKTNWCAYTASIWGLSVFVFISIFLFIVIFKPKIFYLKEKYNYRIISPIEKDSFIAKIENHFITHKAFLDSEITMKQVAKELLISEKILSQVINENYKINFRTFINQLRLDHSIKQLSEDLSCSSNISEIMYSSGFNSKSVFNYLFKERTSMTPKEYRKVKIKKGS